MLGLGGFGFDRQLRLSAVPLDAQHAEPLMKVIRNLHARVFISADRVDVYQTAYERHAIPHVILFAHLQKVDILGPANEMIATIAGSSLPAAASR